MATPRDRILIVSNDPVISDLIGRQALQAAGYQAIFATHAGDALTKAAQLGPEIIIADLHLPGLSGKDLLVGLASQGSNIPVIILAQKGQEAAVIHTFRLGAADYLLWPVREAEVIAAVERQLRQVHERREREQLSRQLQQANGELQQRVRELTTIFSIGKAVTTVIDQSTLFEKILDGALTVTKADLGWFLLREETSKNFNMVAQRNLPTSLASHSNQPLDDGISSLVAMSGEPLSIFGEPLRRFKVSSLGQSAMIVPIKVQKQVVGLLVALRKQAASFSASDQHLIEAVADYASISLVNARLFRAVEERAQSLQSLAETAQFSEKINAEIVEVVRKELSVPLEQSRTLLERLSRDPAWWSAEQKQLLAQLAEQTGQMAQISTSLTRVDSVVRIPGSINEILRTTVDSLAQIARQRGVTLVLEIPEEKVSPVCQPEALYHSMCGLISNAIKQSPTSGKVMVRLEKTRSNEAHIVVTDSGPGVDPRLAAHLFEKKAAGSRKPYPFGGIGIRLPLIQEMITAMQGKIWVESKPEQGTSFHITLPLKKSDHPLVK